MSAATLACGPYVVAPGTATLEGAGAFPVRAVYATRTHEQGDPSGRWTERDVVFLSMFASPVECRDGKLVGDTNGVNAAIEFNERSLQPGPFTIADLSTYSESWAWVNGVRYAAGEGVLTRVDEGGIAGSFSLSGDIPDPASGTFVAPYCPIPFFSDR